MRSQHPGLDVVLRKLHRHEQLTGEEVERLRRQLEQLSAPANAHAGTVTPGQPGDDTRPACDDECRDPVPGHATGSGCERLARRSGAQAAGFYRRAQDLVLSSLGIGTYHGAMDRATDSAYADAIEAALRGGVNLVDTSLNYRLQHSERNVATGLRRFFGSGGARDEVAICSKAGFLVPGALAPETLVDVAGAMHCMAPVFLADQLARSLTNLGLETIDVYYLHNPETQLRFVDHATFMARLRRSFAWLEGAVAAGRIRYYGTATWDGYRGGGLDLRTLAQAALDVAGAGHHFRFVQMPLNLGTREALASVGELGENVFDLATTFGITVVASASLLQGRLVQDLPADIVAAMPGLATDAQRALQFTRSTPGITAALVGMRRTEHVAENLALARVPPLAAAPYRNLRRAVEG